MATQRVLPALGGDRESAVHDASLEPVALSSIALVVHLGHASIPPAQSARPVDERSKFHHSRKVGIELLGRQVVGPLRELDSGADWLRSDQGKV